MPNNNMDRLANCVDLLLDAVFLVDADGRIDYVNAACENIFGYRPDEMIGRQLADFVAPEDRTRTAEEAAQVMAGTPRLGFENRYVRKDGQRVHIMWSARWSEADQLRVGVARDVTAQRRAEQRQAAFYAVATAVHQASDLGSLFQQIHTIIGGRIQLGGFAIVSRGKHDRPLEFCCRQGPDGQPLTLDEALALEHCESAMQREEALTLPGQSLSPGASSELRSEGDGEAWLILPLATRQGPIGALLLKAGKEALQGEDDLDLLHYVAAQLATAMEREQLKADLLHAARYDALTNLPNRRLFHDRLATALKRSARRKSQMALLFIDINDFKAINDNFGHAAGDYLLQHIARCLEGCVRKADTVARLGGDEFVVILEAVHGVDDARGVIDKIRAALLQGLDLEGRAITITASVGMALYPEHGTEAEALLKHADGVMYREKTGAPPPYAKD